MSGSPKIIHVVDEDNPICFYVTNAQHVTATRIEVCADADGKLSIHAIEEPVAAELCDEHE